MEPLRSASVMKFLPCGGLAKRTRMTTRREAVFGLAGLWALHPALAGAAAKGGDAFSWSWLQDRALALSREAWRAPRNSSPALERMDYDAIQQVEYRPERTLWADHEDAFGVRFFPLSKTARRAVSINIVENGIARPFAYSPSLYRFPAKHPMAALGKHGGFSGFRFMNKGGRGDWLAFQGASYFRSAGPLHQYGLSARGLAVNTGNSGPEEFPEFTHFWLERGENGVTVYALLDGPSVTGAYRIVNHLLADQMLQDVSMTLHLRSSVERLGIAPLTSMFWYGEGHRAKAKDWRPEIHDSDGLAIRTGNGERIWRPLNNPPRAQMNSFADPNIRGFGLLQRDRSFDHYQDDAVFYEKRPSLWIEPLGNWGAGAVMLYEIPTTSEYEDNIVAFWTPAAAATAGSRYSFDYRMRWIGNEPEALPVARTVDCWTGEGGRPGQPPSQAVTKVVADFAGERFNGLTYKSPVKPVVSVTNGKLVNSGTFPVDGTHNRWRLILDIERDNGEPTDIRAFLSLNQEALTETFVYQLF